MTIEQSHMDVEWVPHYDKHNENWYVVVAARADGEVIEPPAGEGYQIWETVSEGSPISPVFATPEELAHYMAGNPQSADKGSSFESWTAFIRGTGWAPTMVAGPGGIRTGPDAAFPDGKLYDQSSK